MPNFGRFVTGIAALALLLTGAIGAQQQRGSTPETRNAPTGAAPRLSNGRPDFNGVWEHAYVPDMSVSARNTAQQKGPGPLPLTAAGNANIKSYDPEKDGDYTGMCMPYGLTRSFNGPLPIQIMQTDRHVAFLFEL